MQPIYVPYSSKLFLTIPRIYCNKHNKRKKRRKEILISHNRNNCYLQQLPPCLPAVYLWCVYPIYVHFMYIPHFFSRGLCATFFTLNISLLLCSCHTAKKVCKKDSLDLQMIWWEKSVLVWAKRTHSGEQNEEVIFF